MRLVLNASVWSHGVAVKEEISRAMFLIDQEHKLVTGRDAEFTSIVDGKHHTNSLHYAGLACDLRTWYLGGIPERKIFAAAIAQLLGDDYDVVLKLKPPHIHTEFQPTR